MTFINHDPLKPTCPGVLIQRQGAEQRARFAIPCNATWGGTHVGAGRENKWNGGLPSVNFPPFLFGNAFSWREQWRLSKATLKEIDRLRKKLGNPDAFDAGTAVIL